MCALTSTKNPTVEQTKSNVQVQETELIQKMTSIINENLRRPNQVLHGAESNCAKASGASLFSKQPQKS
jgi:hypothetical protein